MNRILRMTEMVHEILRQTIDHNDVAVDATAGNGNDTLFLAQTVGSYGKVYAFDVQKKAIEETRKRLEDNVLNDRVSLIQDGHENLNKYVKEQVKAIVYNLGYLPGGDKNIKTCVESTLLSLQQGLELLSPGGIITVVVYPGHIGGDKEAKEVVGFLESLSSPTWQVLIWKRLNDEGEAPYLIVVNKQGSIKRRYPSEV